MSIQSSIVIIVGHRFEKIPEFEEPEENRFHNIDTYRKQNMDGNLKFVVDGMNGEYVILGLPLSVTYLDEGEILGIQTYDQDSLKSFAAGVEKRLKESPFMGDEIPNVKLHVLMHVT